MRTILLLCLLGLIGIGLSFGMATKPKYISLVVNSWNEQTLPKKFRTLQDAFQRTSNLAVNQDGIERLRASGSSQFSQENLQTLKEALKSHRVTVVDLREESHGFVNGIAISWHAAHNWGNRGRHLFEILNDEKRRLNFLKERFMVLTHHHKLLPVPLFPKFVETEENLVHRMGWNYVRLPVTDHLKPTNYQIDRFVQLIKATPADGWLHFHCAAGEGRTSTFLTMYDMTQNASRVSLEDIFLRQWMLGGVNFFSVPSADWKKSYWEERVAFLTQFYHYCQDNPHLERTWSEWLVSSR